MNLTNLSRAVLIQCVDAQDNPVDGCSYKIDIKADQAGLDNGGHDPADHIGDRSLVKFGGAAGASGSIPLEGITLQMILPQIAGDNAINITGTDPTPSQNQLKADPLVFEMKVKDLVPIASAINVVVDSHSGHKIAGVSDGGYATPAFASDVSQTVNAFQAKVLMQTGAQANVIQSQGASLYWGGLFDKNDDWHTPHCGHRDGNALDISWKSLTVIERKILAITVTNSKTVKFYSKEAPGTASDHWHLMPK